MHYNYAADLDKLNLYYNFLASDETELKRRYKMRKGYKIAYNWKRIKQEELGRNEYNRNRALKALNQKYESYFIDELSDGNFGAFEKGAVLLSGIFFAIGSSPIVDWVERTLSKGMNVVLTTDIEGIGQETYKNDIDFDLAIRNVMRTCNKWQYKKESDYPTIVFSYGKVPGTNTIYFNLKANK